MGRVGCSIELSSVVPVDPGIHVSIVQRLSEDPIFRLRFPDFKAERFEIPIEYIGDFEDFQFRIYKEAGAIAVAKNVSKEPKIFKCKLVGTYYSDKV